MGATRSRASVRKSYSRLREVLDLPPLIQVQLESFRWFQEEGLRELLDEISPIVGYNKNLELYFGEYRFGEPKYTQEECRERDMTYAAPLWVKVKLINKEKWGRACCRQPVDSLPGRLLHPGGRPPDRT